MVRNDGCLVRFLQDGALAAAAQAPVDAAPFMQVLFGARDRDGGEPEKPSNPAHASECAWPLD
jgi:hypothetical protein